MNFSLQRNKERGVIMRTWYASTFAFSALSGCQAHLVYAKSWRPIKDFDKHQIHLGYFGFLIHCLRLEEF